MLLPRALHSNHWQPRAIELFAIHPPQVFPGPGYCFSNRCNRPTSASSKSQSGLRTASPSPPFFPTLPRLASRWGSWQGLALAVAKGRISAWQHGCGGLQLDGQRLNGLRQGLLAGSPLLGQCPVGRVEALLVGLLRGQHTASQRGTTVSARGMQRGGGMLVLGGSGSL